MVRIAQITNLIFVVFLASACLPMTTPAPAATTLSPSPTSAEKYHSFDTSTSIEEIDTILAAINSNDKQQLTDLFSYTIITCKTVNALGGPPPCREGETQGTPVEVLPVLGSEGSYLWKDEIGNWDGLEVDGLYAVYQVSETAYSDEYYPKGDDGIILVGDEYTPGIVLQIKDGGIVRIDYVLDSASDALTGILERDAERVTLAPKE